MIIDNTVEQGSLDWLRLRLGVLTASVANKLLTPGKLALSAQRKELMNLLVAEWAIGEPVDDFGGTYWTERGSGLEPQAMAYFELQTGLETKRVGFVFKDELKACGCSPDSLIYESGNPVAGLELKCPTAATHIGYLLEDLDGAHKYDYQVQFSLWVTGLPVWYFMSYFPGLPPVLRKEGPIKKWQSAFDAHVPVFLDELWNAKKKLIELRS